MKKSLSLMLIFSMMLSCVTVAFADEPILPFTDVTQSDWFYNDVADAYATGLINGKTDTLYQPDDNMTYAETIKLAACMNQYVSEGKVSLKNGDPWYQTYVDYAKDQGIITREYDYNMNASRSGYMEIFANCLPDDNLKEINYIEDNSIPDVKSSAKYAPAVYKMYRAGILTGVDEEHNCNPSAYIKRSEVAAILTRMMNEDTRKHFSIGNPAVTPTETPTATTEPSSGTSTAASRYSATYSYLVNLAKNKGTYYQEDNEYIYAYNSFSEGSSSLTDFLVYSDGELKVVSYGTSSSGLVITTLTIPKHQQPTNNVSSNIETKSGRSCSFVGYLYPKEFDSTYTVYATYSDFPAQTEDVAETVGESVFALLGLLDVCVLQETEYSIADLGFTEVR